MLAAGTVPWRRRDGRLEVALVHRPKYDDWSWPKGKLDPGEAAAVAAVRETAEETGLAVSLGLPLPPASYLTVDRTGRRVTKEVHYWAAHAGGSPTSLAHEVDEVRWLGVAEAAATLDYARDRDQLRALVRAETAGHLDTWPLLVVRHAVAVPRREWDGEDALRPLEPAGTQRAQTLVPLLTAYGVGTLFSSPSLRCRDTMVPAACALGVRLVEKKGLSEERYAVAPDRAPRHVRRLLEQGAPAAVCTHGAVVPVVLDELSARVPAGDGGRAAAEALREASSTRMAKGEALVAHVAAHGARAHVVAVERHLP